MEYRMKNRHDRLCREGTVRVIEAISSCWHSMLTTALAAALLFQASGCTRVFYRKQADKEVSEILADKDRYPAWKIDDFHVYPDPRARYADPTDPDHPPKPPDDPAAYDLSPNPQKPGKAGVVRIEGTGYLELLARWDQENREKLDAENAAEALEDLAPALPPPEKAAQEEPPAQEGEIKWVAAKVQAEPGLKNVQAVAAPKTMGATLKDALESANVRSTLDIYGKPAYRLTLDQAAELATFNAREYQDQRENLYLAALPVALERFSFTSQLFAAQEGAREYSGQTSVNGSSNNWSLNNGGGLSKVLPTGALLLLNFANTTVFDFLNPKNTVSTTSLNFSAVQPLLQGGGQAIALESLTQAERNLLYQIRVFARFRKQLYVEIASNSGGSINGSSFQPVGVLSNNSSGSTGLGNTGVTPGVLPGPARPLSPVPSSRPAHPGR